jgi:hypothetical protein
MGGVFGGGGFQEFKRLAGPVPHKKFFAPGKGVLRFHGQGERKKEKHQGQGVQKARFIPIHSYSFTLYNILYTIIIGY